LRLETLATAFCRDRNSFSMLCECPIFHADVCE